MAISLLFPLIHGFGSFGGHPGPGLRGATPQQAGTITKIELAFSSGRHSFSRTLTLGADEQKAGGLLDKVAALIGIKKDLLVLWKGDVLLDEVRPCRTRTI